MFQKQYWSRQDSDLSLCPLGFLLGLRCSNSLRGSSGLRNLKGAMLLGLITSVTIELLQLITRTGTCETDDVICNTVGCAIGAMIGTTLYKLSKIIKLKRS